MTGTRVLITLVFLSIAASLGAQPKPNFSGEWVLNKAESKLQLQSLANLESGVVRIEHREPDFSFDRTFVVGGKESKTTYRLTTDGKESASQNGDQQHFSTLSWDGDVLVYFTRIVAPQGEATNTVRYRLRDGGRVLEAAESFRGPKLSYDNLWVLDKKD